MTDHTINSERTPLTAEVLRELLSYDAETGAFRWRQGQRAGAAAGWKRPRGYVVIRILGRAYLGHRIAWLYVTGEWPAEQIDHINRDKGDTRFTNLRAATRAENSRNTDGVPSRRTHSRFKGVTREPRSRNRFMARIFINGKRLYLGSFGSEEVAAEAYRAAARKYHGEFAACQ